MAAPLQAAQLVIITFVVVALVVVKYTCSFSQKSSSNCCNQ